MNYYASILPCSAGKQGWKSKRPNFDAVGISANREASNVIFRNHRIQELKFEGQSIVRFCQGETLLSKSNELLVNLLETRLLYFSGGGTTDLSSLFDSASNGQQATDFVRSQLLCSLWCSYGLSVAVQRLQKTNTGEKTSKQNMANQFCEASIPKFVKERCRPIIRDDGFIDFSRVFSPLWDESFDILTDQNKLVASSPAKPIYIELGSGSGDWIVSQAFANPSTNYVAVELRADRVAQTLTNLALSQHDKAKSTFFAPLSNLCCVGAECGSFLRTRVKSDSISKIFVNHPEPPTQTYGAEDDSIAFTIEAQEPAHMLNSNTLFHAAQCLKLHGEGKLIIVTDNLWYARLVCLTLVKLLTRHPKILEQMDLEGDPNLNLSQLFHVPNSEGKVSLFVSHGVLLPDVMGIFNVNREEGCSFFDRLWRVGGGRHAHKTDRYIIAMQTCRPKNVLRNTVCETTAIKHEISSNSSKSLKRGGKKHRKVRNPHKQALRNQRRLERRKGLL